MIEFDVSDYTNINPAQYVNEKRKLQIELLKLQKWVISQKKNIAIVFEGRDTAGKTGSISVLSRYLIPSNFRLVKFGIPTKNESRTNKKRLGIKRLQLWSFQRSAWSGLGRFCP